MNPTNPMHWAVVFLVVAVVAGLLGFTGLLGAASGLARILFWLGVILAIIAFMVMVARRG